MKAGWRIIIKYKHTDLQIILKTEMWRTKMPCRAQRKASSVLSRITILCPEKRLPNTNDVVDYYYIVTNKKKMTKKNVFIPT